MPVKAPTEILELREAIAAEIREKRPKLSEGSLKTYCGGLSNLYRRLGGSGGPSWFTRAHNEILEHVRTIESVQTRKTLLAALVVLTGLDSFRQPMLVDIKTQAGKYLEQRTSPDRAEKLITPQQVREIHEALVACWKMRPSMNNWVDMLISFVCSGVLGPELPPRRLEYSTMLMKGGDSSRDNVIDWRNRQFVFNVYKMARSSGQERITIPAELYKLLLKWRKINDSPYMLINSKGEPFKPTTLSKRITVLFRGNGIDSLRSIFLSGIYANVPAMQDMQNLARKMGHSVEAALNFYVKRDGDHEG